MATPLSNGLLGGCSLYVSAMDGTGGVPGWAAPDTALSPHLFCPRFSPGWLCRSLWPLHLAFLSRRPLPPWATAPGGGLTRPPGHSHPAVAWCAASDALARPCPAAYTQPRWGARVPSPRLLRGPRGPEPQLIKQPNHA